MRITALVLTIALLVPGVALARSCESVTAPADAVAQVWDLTNTRKQFRRGLVEVDPLVAPFTGKSKNNVQGELVEGVAFDGTMLYLTRKSKKLRCAWEGIDALAHLDAIYYSNGWRLTFRLGGSR